MVRQIRSVGRGNRLLGEFLGLTAGLTEPELFGFEEGSLGSELLPLGVKLISFGLKSLLGSRLFLEPPLAVGFQGVEFGTPVGKLPFRLRPASVPVSAVFLEGSLGGVQFLPAPLEPAFQLSTLSLCVHVALLEQIVKLAAGCFQLLDQSPAPLSPLPFCLGEAIAEGLGGPEQFRELGVNLTTPAVVARPYGGMRIGR